MTQNEETKKPAPSPSPPPPMLKLEELFGAGKAHLKRTLIFEMDDGKEIERTVGFRRLTFKEINALSTIPRTDSARYTKTVVFLASIEPKFADVDKLDSVSNGFVQNYCNVILAESGKDPFLVKG